MSMDSHKISVVSTVDEHGDHLDVTVLGTPSEVRQALEDREGRWTRFETPQGGRVYLHPRFAARVSRARAA
jgi:hypothetical protein